MTTTVPRHESRGISSFLILWNALKGTNKGHIYTKYFTGHIYTLINVL